MKKVEIYLVEAQDPTAHPAELLQMLLRRDALANAELSAEELDILREGDEHLLHNAAAFYAELSVGIDFAKRRRDEDIPPQRWWWYLDVIDELPTSSSKSQPPEPMKPSQTAQEAAS